MQVVGHAFSKYATFQKSGRSPQTRTVHILVPRIRLLNSAGRQKIKVKAEGDDQDFEDRLSRLKTAKGKTPYGQSRRDERGNGSHEDKKPQSKKAKYDFSGEKLHLETAPHRGDLATNIALGTTLLWLPLTFAAIGRAAFVKYRFTDKRISVITSAPWKSERREVQNVEGEQLDAAYQEVKDVQTVGRGIGFWGDMVITLRNNDKIELRSLPSFLELKKYIFERRDALTKESSTASAGSGSSQGSSSRGFL